MTTTRVSPWPFLKVMMVLAGAAGAVFIGYQIYIARLCQPEPQRLTCAELAANGPGDNAYVILTDAFAPSTWFVYQAKTYDEDGPYEYVYTPIVDTGGPWYQEALARYAKDGEDFEMPPPKDLHILAKFKNIRDGEHLAEKLDRNEIKGMIINTFSPITTEDERLISRTYRGTDADECWVLEMDRRPWPMILLAPALVVAVGLFLVGTTTTIRDAIKRRHAKTPPPTPEGTPPARPAPPRRAGRRHQQPLRRDRVTHDRLDQQPVRRHRR